MHFRRKTAIGGGIAASGEGVAAAGCMPWWRCAACIIIYIYTALHTRGVFANNVTIHVIIHRDPPQRPTDRLHCCGSWPRKQLKPDTFRGMTVNVYIYIYIYYRSFVSGTSRIYIYYNLYIPHHVSILQHPRPVVQLVWWRQRLSTITYYNKSAPHHHRRRRRHIMPSCGFRRHRIYCIMSTAKIIILLLLLSIDR